MLTVENDWGTMLHVPEPAIAEGNQRGRRRRHFFGKPCKLCINEGRAPHQKVSGPHGLKKYATQDMTDCFKAAQHRYYPFELCFNDGSQVSKSFT